MRRSLERKGVRSVFMALSFLLSAGAVIAYFIATIVETNSLGTMAATSLEWKGIIASVTGSLLMLAALLWKDPKGMFTVFVPALWLFALIMLVASQVQNIAYASAGITDMGLGILPSFVAGSVMYVLAVILAVAGAVYKFDV